MLLAVLMFHSLLAKPFYIPSESMMPGLLKGDRLVVSKYPYGWSWVSASFHVLPRSDWRVNAATPEYGDIVIPVHPERDEDYIKRVVALPGDRIAVVNGQIVLNGNRRAPDRGAGDRNSGRCQFALLASGISRPSHYASRRARKCAKCRLIAKPCPMARRI